MNRFDDFEKIDVSLRFSPTVEFLLTPLYVLLYLLFVAIAVVGFLAAGIMLAIAASIGIWLIVIRLVLRLVRLALT